MYYAFFHKRDKVGEVQSLTPRVEHVGHFTFQGEGVRKNLKLR